MSVEQYRPSSWSEVVGQPTKEIQAGLEDGATRFLFYGPPGTGKTTVAYLVACEVQGSMSGVLEFNASDERGIDTVRDRIIPATRQTTLTGAQQVVFLDEMESMTTDAQQALRRPMEQTNTIFVLACNDVARVHAAVRSRCREYEFNALPSQAVKARIRRIADDENNTLSSDQLETIASFAAGDMRNAIQQYTQIAHTETGTKIGATPGRAVDAAAQNFMD